jgi:hypothetical protein
MREQKFKTEPKPLEVRLWTLKDKDSNFRAKEPDQHCIEFKVGNVIIREIWSEDAAASKANYDWLKTMLTQATKPR